MNFLQERIVKDGVVKAGNVLKVDSFLNHQMDIGLLEQIGTEFCRRFAGSPITKVLTIESSGIAPAVMTALIMNVPLVILKKSTSAILQDDILRQHDGSGLGQGGNRHNVDVGHDGHPNAIRLHPAHGTAEKIAGVNAQKGLIRLAAKDLGVQQIKQSVDRHGSVLLVLVIFLNDVLKV